MRYINQLAKSLIKLKGMKQARVAMDSGVKRGNLSTWLKGKCKLGEEAEENILRALGVVRGQLDRDIVHYWQTGLDVSDLNFVFETMCPKPKLQPLMSDELIISGGRGKVGYFPLIAITNGSQLKIIVKSKPTLEESLKRSADEVAVTKETIDNSTWVIGEKPRAVSAQVYDRWQQGQATVEEFDEFISSDTALTWTYAVELAEGNDISAAEVIDEIKIMIKKKRKKPILK